VTDDLELEQAKAKALAYWRRAQARLGWIFDHDYPEPSDTMKPFVYALMTRVVDEDDERAVEALKKLFPPRGGT
jgi:hypothetical protein